MRAIMNVGCQASIFLVAATCMFQPASAFVASPHSATYLRTTGGGYLTPQSSRGAFHPRHASFLRATPVEGDTPDVVDTRLAGWRLSKSQPPSSSDPDGLETSQTDGGEGAEPVCGDVVEYPLSESVKREAVDGREKGVGVIVSINKLRNDSWKLPDELLDRAELQVLCPDPDGGDGGVWMADELESCAFAQLTDMRVLKAKVNGALDKWRRWTIDDELSEGCGARDADWEYDIV